MKKLAYYILSMFTVCSFSACDSLLDEDPIYTQNSSVVFSSKGNAELALLGCYGYLAENRAYGQMMQEVPMAASGFVWTQRMAGDSNDLASLQASASTAIAPDLWDGMYKAISEVNAFLESLDKSSLSDDIKVQMGGEAKFIRGLAYYNLVSLFGDVPLKTVASSSDGISLPRTPVAQVLEQVEKDMKDAMKIAEESVDGRANAWAAKAFLGKVYYKMACLGINSDDNWKNAKAMFDEVYKKKKYSLESKFEKLFGDWVTGSPESIFQVNFSIASTRCYNRASNRFAPTSSTTGIAWGTYKATKAAYDLHEGTYPGDPRIKGTFQTAHRERTGNNQANPKAMVGDELSANDSVYAYPYLTYTIPGNFVIKNNKPTTILKKFVTKLPYVAFSDPKNPSLDVIRTYSGAKVPQENTAIQKTVTSFVTSYAQTNWPTFMKVYDINQAGTNSHKNVLVYRYAEMLLLMADVYNELGEKQKAIDLADEVLDRARKSGGNSVQPAKWSYNLTKEEVTEKLYFERIIELCGEPGMYEMARVRGVKYFKKVLEIHNNHEFTKACDVAYDTSANKFTDRLYNGKTGITDDFVKKNLLLPIPNTEISANPGISSADNNFGYN